MGYTDETRRDPSTADAPLAAPIPFARRLAASVAFTALFKEGMDLVEDTAAYLDGPGREESRRLARPAAIAYASESMRLTTRLMQVASWLLLQRAVNEGELTPAQAMSEKHRVRLADQGIGCAADLFDALPPTLKEFTVKSLRLQARVAHLDRSIAAADDFAPPPRASAVAAQVERLRQAFTH